MSLLATAFLVKANAMFAFGRRREAAGLYRLVREVASENGLTEDVLRGTNNLAGLIGELDLSASVDLYREGLALARKVGRRDFKRQFAGNLGYAAFLAGDWDIAVAELEAVVSPDMEPRDGL